MHKKSYGLSGLVSILALALMAMSPGTTKADDYIGGWQSKYPTIKYGVISIETATDIIKSQKAFAEYASKELGVKFELFTASEYAGIMNALASGQIQAGWLGASSYASTWSDCKCVEPL
ncbi:MAG: PhnD/SsuA/transferrin family substrate-binding protein, partial [Methyloligellaceae bacterium]